MKGAFAEPRVRRQLEAEIGTALHLKVDELKIRMKTTLVGLEYGEYLIVKMPRVHHMGNVSSLFPKGKNLLVRYAQKGSVFGFDSVILGTVFSPKNLLFLSYPESVEIQNHRAHDRYDCFLPASIENDDGVFCCSVVDIGKGGCRLEVDPAEGPGERAFGNLHRGIRMNLGLPGGEDGLCVSGILRHITKDGERVVCGVEFEALDETRRNELYDYILEVGSLP